MLVRGINGGIFYAMVITTIVGMIFGLIDIPSTVVGSIPSLEPTFGVAIYAHFQVDNHYVRWYNSIV